uniref:Uncharacterized protein n=1 Tax=Naja naja TaxID=35670 RepID=A0A8C6XN57_NAJNA
PSLSLGLTVARPGSLKEQPELIAADVHHLREIKTFCGMGTLIFEWALPDHWYENFTALNVASAENSAAAISLAMSRWASIGDRNSIPEMSKPA